MQNSLIERMRPALEKGLDMAITSGASAAKLAFNHTESVSCDFESGRLKSSGSRESASYGITVVVNGRRGTASGNRLDDVGMMVTRAIELAAAGSHAHFASYPSPGNPVAVKMHSESVRSLDRTAMIDACRTVVDRLHAAGADLDINAGCHRTEGESLMLTSGGVDHTTFSTRWSLGAGIQRTRGTDMLFAGTGRSWREVNAFFDPAYLAERIEEDLCWSKQTVSPPVGPVVMVLPPDAVGYVLEPALAGLNGRNVAKGTSPLKDHLGEAFFDPGLTVVDRPHIDFSPSAAEIDSAGIPTVELSLIENGVIRMFLYDLDTAGLAGVEPTGHSGCQPYNPQILPGKIDSAQLLASIDNGIYVKSLLGFGQSNIANGDFSANVGLGYRIQNGRITGRVKDVMLAGNLFEMLKTEVGISSDVDPLTSLPYMALKGAVASAAQS